MNVKVLQNIFVWASTYTNISRATMHYFTSGFVFRVVRSRQYFGTRWGGRRVHKTKTRLRGHTAECGVDKTSCCPCLHCYTRVFLLENEENLQSTRSDYCFNIWNCPNNVLLQNIDSKQGYVFVSKYKNIRSCKKNASKISDRLNIVFDILQVVANHPDAFQVSSYI